MAKLYFRFGAMNSGKSTAIIQVAHNYEERGMRILLIKPEIDTKGHDSVVSRLGVERSVDVVLWRHDSVAQRIHQYISDHRAIHCVLVDEAQFLLPSQIDELYWFAVHENVPVICYGLRTDFLLHSFPGSERLLALAHTLEELKTVCRCNKKAVCNMRLVDWLPVFHGDQIAIDGEAVTYESVCGDCYAEHKQASEKKIGRA